MATFSRGHIYMLCLDGLDPRSTSGIFCLKFINRVDLLHGQSDVIQSVDKTMLFKGIQLKMELGTIGCGYGLSLKIH